MFQHKCSKGVTLILFTYVSYTISVHLCVVFVYNVHLTCITVCFVLPFSFLLGEAEVNTRTEDFTIYTMTPITAECTGRGFPQPSITWTHNGSPIENSSRILIYEKNVTKEEHGLTSVSSYLNISNVRLSDGGIYECIVANRIVNASANFTLTVRGKSCPLLQAYNNINADNRKYLVVKVNISWEAVK